MKTIGIIMMVMLFYYAPSPAQEYATRVVQSDEADGFIAGSLIDVTKESSSTTKFWLDFVSSKAYVGEYITGIACSGYNPGKELKRHIRVWVTTSFLGGLGHPVFDESPAYDNDYTIPSGGTAEAPVTLLSLDFDEPYKLLGDPCFYVKIESSGETADEQLYFEYNTGNNRSVVNFTVMSEVRYLTGKVSNQDGEPVAGAHIQLTPCQDYSKYGTDTDVDGHYTLRVEKSCRPYVVTLTAQGYATYTGKARYSSGQGTMVMLTDRQNERDFSMYSRVSYKKDRRATIILPVTPNPELGRYYRLDRRENENVIFEREESPQANVPYVIFPNTDFELNIGDYDLCQEPGSIVLPYPDGSSYPVPYAAIYGAYQNMDVIYTYTDQQTFFFDETPDCETADMPLFGRIGACRAYLRMAAACPKQENFVFNGESTDNLVYSGGMTGVVSLESSAKGISPLFDLQGRRLTATPQRGMYIRDGRKYVVK